MKFQLVQDITNYHTIWITVGVLFVLIAVLPLSAMGSMTLFWILLTIILVYVVLLGWQLGGSLKKQMAYQKDLQDAQEKLKALDVGKNEFLSFATHQLRSPLTSMKWGLNAVEDAIKDNPDTLKVIQQLRITADDMVSTVNDLLDISKIEQGGLVMTTEPVDLVELLNHLTEEYKITANTKGLALSFKTDLPVAIINGDKTKLRQVFTNIVDNALKYTQAGSVTVDLFYNSLKNSFIIDVIDTGAGISAEELQNLFEKFIRGKAGKTFSPGSGLGLYLGKKIVELHHGEITVTSPGVEKGSTFSVSLPKNI